MEGTGPAVSLIPTMQKCQWSWLFHLSGGASLFVLLSWGLTQLLSCVVCHLAITFPHHYGLMSGK